MPRPVTTSVGITVAAPQTRVFEAAAGCELPAVFAAHRGLPGVMKVDEHKAAWSAPGQVRLLTLSDGSTVREELTAFSPPDSYAYRVSGFTGPFAALAAEGRGEWRFISLGSNATRIDWTYSFTPKSALAAPAVFFIVKALWPVWLRASLRRLKQQIERARA